MAGCKDFPFVKISAPSLHVRIMLSCYSINNAIQWNLLNNVCFLTPSMYIRVKRNETLKNGQKKACNGNVNNFCRPLNTWVYSNFLPSIKYISSYCLYFNLIYSIQQSPQFTSAPWSNTLRKHFINFKHAEHAILWSTPSTLC